MSHLKSNGGEQKLKRKKPEKHKLLLMLKLKLLDSRQLMILPLWRLSQPLLKLELSLLSKHTSKLKKLPKLKLKKEQLLTKLLLKPLPKLKLRERKSFTLQNKREKQSIKLLWLLLQLQLRLLPRKLLLLKEESYLRLPKRPRKKQSRPRSLLLLQKSKRRMKPLWLNRKLNMKLTRQHNKQPWKK